MDDNGTAKPGTGPQTHIPVWPQLPEGEALHRAAVALERIADALEAQPSLRDQMAMAAMSGLLSDPAFTMLKPDAAEHFYDLADIMLATRQKEE